MNESNDYQRGYIAGQQDQWERAATPQPTFKIDEVDGMVVVEINIRPLQLADSKGLFKNQCAMRVTIEPMQAAHLGERMSQKAKLATIRRERGEVDAGST